MGKARHTTTPGNRPATHVEIEVQVRRPEDLPHEEFHQFAIAVMDELVLLETGDEMLSDVDVASDYGETADQATMTVGMIVFTGDSLEANIKASTTVRTAMHAIGVGTESWPHADDIRAAYQLETKTAPVHVPECV